MLLPLLSYKYSPNLPLKFFPPPSLFRNTRKWSCIFHYQTNIPNHPKRQRSGMSHTKKRGAGKQKWNNKQTMEHGSSLRSLSLFLLSPWQARPANNKENEKQQTTHDPNTKTHTKLSHLCREFFFFAARRGRPPFSGLRFLKAGSLGYVSTDTVLFIFSRATSRLARFHFLGIFWGINRKLLLFLKNQLSTNQTTVNSRTNYILFIVWGSFIPNRKKWILPKIFG
jgi:hypothetical protein